MILQDLIRSSFRAAGLMKMGQVFNADEQIDGLFILNAMLEAWSIERLNVFTVQPQIINLNASQQSYQWGTGAADINALAVAFDAYAAAVRDVVHLEPTAV